MNLKFIKIFLTFCLFNISFCDRFTMLMNSPNTTEDRNKKIQILAYRLYGKKYERSIIDFVLKRILNGPKIV